MKKFRDIKQHISESSGHGSQGITEDSLKAKINRQWDRVVDPMKQVKKDMADPGMKKWERDRRIEMGRGSAEDIAAQDKEAVDRVYPRNHPEHPDFEKNKGAQEKNNQSKTPVITKESTTKNQSAFYSYSPKSKTKPTQTELDAMTYSELRKQKQTDQLRTVIRKLPAGHSIERAYDKMGNLMFPSLGDAPVEQKSKVTKESVSALSEGTNDSKHKIGDTVSFYGHPDAPRTTLGKIINKTESGHFIIQSTRNNVSMSHRVHPDQVRHSFRYGTKPSEIKEGTTQQQLDQFERESQGLPPLPTNTQDPKTKSSDTKKSMNPFDKFGRELGAQLYNKVHGIDHKVTKESVELDEMAGAGMNTRAIHKHLTKSGWSLTRTDGGHDVYTHPKATNHIAVPRHKGDLKAPLVLGILKSSRIKEDVDTQYNIDEALRAPEGRKTHDGEFQEKDRGNWFTYKKTNDPWAKKHGLPHEIDVLDGVRYGHVKSTVVHIATEDNADGSPKIEKWNLKKHNKWIKEDVVMESRKSEIVKDAWKNARSKKEETSEPQSDTDKKMDCRKDTFQKDPELNDSISKE